MSKHVSAATGLLAYLPNADLLDLASAPHLWNINAIESLPGGTRVSGWSLPHGGRLDNTGLEINGGVFPVAFNPKPAGQFAELYPWHPNAAFAGFALEIPAAVLDLGRTRELTMRSVPLSGPAGPGYTLDILVDDLRFVIPEPEIAARIGVTEAMHYTMFGRSIFRGFERVLETRFNRRLSDMSTIVDWGCGSGRVSRHIVPGLVDGQSLRGFDIDAPAIAWSNAHIGAHFAVSRLEPPLDLADGSADLVVAYSVFTHLSERAFGTWLAELARILKPGGALLFTVLGDYAMASLAPTFPRVAHEAWRERGIYDDSGNSQLETIDVSGETYRNTWVKRAFVERVLAPHFDFLDYVCPFHFYQDLVVARRR